METKTEIVTQYLSDMKVLEQHIQEALEKQVGTTTDQPDLNRAIQTHLATAKRHVERLQTRMEALGNQDSVVDKAKSAVTTLAGHAAGAIDTVRTHRTAKDLRDDYTAGSLAAISYVMLKTTALACDDKQTAELAETHLRETVELLQWIARTIPDATVRDLEAEREVKLNTAAAAQVAQDSHLAALYGSQGAHS